MQSLALTALCLLFSVGQTFATQGRSQWLAPRNCNTALTADSVKVNRMEDGWCDPKTKTLYINGYAAPGKFTVDSNGELYAEQVGWFRITFFKGQGGMGGASVDHLTYNTDLRYIAETGVFIRTLPWAPRSKFGVGVNDAMIYHEGKRVSKKGGFSLTVDRGFFTGDRPVLLDPRGREVAELAMSRDGTFTYTYR